MPWSNQSGGPWGQRGGGSGGGGGPWGAGPQGGGGGGQPPDLEQILRRGQDRLKDFIPGGSMGGRGLLVAVLAAIALWLAFGFYTVRPDQVGINLIFGKYTGKTGEGLRYNLPYPIGNVVKPSVTAVNTVQVGYRTAGPQTRAGRDVPEESLMLTGDENIIDIDFDVQWAVNPAKAEDFVFNIQNPEGTIKAVGESAMREVMQNTLDAYAAGVTVRLVQLQSAAPPAQVRESFYDVNAAQQDQVRVQNEAETYASRVVPEARGEAARIVQEAEAYRNRVIAEATGQASRFSQVYDEYRRAPEVIRQRIFLETMERVLGGTDKVLIDQSGQGVVPYLPLNELQPRRPQGAQPPQQPAQGATR